MNNLLGIKQEFDVNEYLNMVSRSPAISKNKKTQQGSQSPIRSQEKTDYNKTSKSSSKGLKQSINESKKAPSAKN